MTRLKLHALCAGGSLIQLLTVVALVTSLASCATSNPYEDSLFFSGSLAEQERLNPRRQALREANYARAGEEEDTRYLSEELGSARRISYNQQVELNWLRDEIRRKRRELDDLNDEIHEVQNGARGDLRALEEQRRDLEDELDELRDRYQEVMKAE
ncbi:hypothetical protein [Verrucomicrobium sp. BvORR106]|uniref:hypothetical protein n=1 Tax=Verrucomicrobium sp. BvORR106 TaxID=1403819 RepID=UPI000570A1B5|nr:hypothetical protein [Verrucomicrobium sp. BvORR106]